MFYLDMKLIYHYTEHYLDGSPPQEKTIEWFQGAQKSVFLESIETMSKEIQPEQFYQFLGSHPDLTDVSNIDKRTMGLMDFYVNQNFPKPDLTNHLIF